MGRKSAKIVVFDSVLAGKWGQNSPKLRFLTQFWRESEGFSNQRTRSGVASSDGHVGLRAPQCLALRASVLGGYSEARPSGEMPHPGPPSSLSPPSSFRQPLRPSPEATPRCCWPSCVEWSGSRHLFLMRAAEHDLAQSCIFEAECHFIERNVLSLHYEEMDPYHGPVPHVAAAARG